MQTDASLAIEEFSPKERKTNDMIIVLEGFNELVRKLESIVEKEDIFEFKNDVLQMELQH